MTGRRAFAGIVFLFAVSFAVALAFGCDTSTPVKSSTADDDATADDDDDGSPPAAPKIDPVTTPTPLNYQSIHGTADAGSIIHVTGGLAPGQTTADAKGNFCLRVGLNSSAMNTLSFTAQNGAGAVSAATVVKIQQAATNLALAGEATASSLSHQYPADTADKANDGLYTTWWRDTIQPWYADALYVPQWIMIKLEQAYYITEINVYWGEDLAPSYEYATVYDVYLNNEETIAELPNEVASGDWEKYGYQLVQHVEQPASQNTEYNHFDISSAPVQSRWLILALYESNSVGFWTGPNNQTLYNFEVAELEGYGMAAPDEACE